MLATSTIAAWLPFMLGVQAIPFPAPIHSKWRPTQSHGKWRPARPHTYGSGTSSRVPIGGGTRIPIGTGTRVPIGGSTRVPIGAGNACQTGTGCSNGTRLQPGSDYDTGNYDAILATAALEYANDSLFAEAQVLADPGFGPAPGQTEFFNSYDGIARPWPGNITHPILPTQRGPPGVDDRTWQNLLSAEWIIFAFYQLAVETFTPRDFAAIGLPDTTFYRLLEIRNNEAGHLRIFQNQISPTSVKPGACRYSFPFTPSSDPFAFLALLTVLEISSMAFLTGLVQQPHSLVGRGAMLAIAEVETRHETWALMDIWKANPFGGASDTLFPYADELLDTTNAFIVPGSCPKINPVYPTPRHRLPELSAGNGTTSLMPGSRISLYFGPDQERQPRFDAAKQYYAVFFHGVGNISVPIETREWPAKEIWVTIPPQFESKGVVVAVLADRPGAPTKESLVAGPAVILEQPGFLGAALLKGF